MSTPPPLPRRLLAEYLGSALLAAIEAEDTEAWRSLAPLGRVAALRADEA